MANLKIKDDASLCKFLQEKYRQAYLSYEPLPRPFCADVKSARAIILGADPSNPQRLFFENGFGLEKPDSPYFRRVEKNLKEIGLALEDVYVQNLCKNYFTTVTSQNRCWNEIAALWRELLKKELDGLFDQKTPVLITAWDIYVALAHDSMAVKAASFYKAPAIISASENFLARPLYPFFRPWYYSLRRPEWLEYRKLLRRLVKSSQ